MHGDDGGDLPSRNTMPLETLSGGVLIDEPGPPSVGFLLCSVPSVGCLPTFQDPMLLGERYRWLKQVTV
jgi:hypothetical protein